MKVKNILASGCSFTQDGLGGLPPTLTQLGWNSYREGDVDYPAKTPQSWASFLAKKIDPDSFVNLATAGHGNYLVSKTIYDMLQTYNYNPKNTLVIFNISHMARMDVVCEYNTENDLIPWPQDILNYSFLKPNSDKWSNVMKNQQSDIEELIIYNTERLRELFEYLDKNKYPFVFTTLADYTDLPIVQEYKEHYIQLPGNGMFEYAGILGLLSEDEFHPNLEAHFLISRVIYDFICEKYNVEVN